MPTVSVFAMRLVMREQSLPRMMFLFKTEQDQAADERQYTNEHEGVRKIDIFGDSRADRRCRCWAKAGCCRVHAPFETLVFLIQVRAPEAEPRWIRKPAAEPVEYLGDVNYPPLKRRASRR